MNKNSSQTKLHFFDTTHEKTEVVEDYTKQALKQEERIIEILSLFEDRDFTGFELIQYFPKNTPISSVKRALTVLYQAGRIKRTGKRLGIYNRNNFTYQIIKNERI